MLYDPHQPGAGKFYEWTDPSNIHLGLTGRGGFRLWRRLEPLREEDSEASTQLGVEIGGLLSDQGGHWNVVIQKIGGNLVYHRGAEEILPAPWAIEITTALLFFHVLDQQGVDDYRAYIENNDVNGQAFQHLLEAMLVDRDPTATHSLVTWVDGQLDTESVLRDWGIHQTTHVPSQSTVLDIATVVEGLHSEQLGTEGSRTFILEHLHMKEPAQAAGDVMLHTYENTAWAISTESSNTGVVRQVIVAESADDAYAIVIYGSPPRYGEKEASLEELVRTAEEITLVFIDAYLTPTVDP
jgi:hypothetical protein